MDLFEDSWKRLKRSKVHAEAFRNEIMRLFPKDGYTVRLDKEGERTWIASAVFNSVLDDEALSLELGEFFYQLRAALDALIWKAVWITEGTEPPAEANRLEFPIYPDEGQFKSAGIHKFKLPQKLRDWLGTIQPFSALANGSPQTRATFLHGVAKEGRKMSGPRSADLQLVCSG